MAYEGLLAETIGFNGHNGDRGEAYLARPLGPGPFPGMVVIHHMPGWDEWTRDVVRRFAQHGYAAIAPHLFFRFGPGSPDDVTARARAAGGSSDDEVVGDVRACMQFLRNQATSNGKVGAIGFCSGGRHAYICACRIAELDAVVDCWGGRVVVNDPADITDKRPVAPIDLTPGLRCPLLGLFGNDDKNPSPADVDKTEEVLKKLGKKYEFHRYDGAGHAFFNYTNPNYRVEQAMDGWKKVFKFLDTHLAAAANR
jgi:carboxymethylenebutenolidase